MIPKPRVTFEVNLGTVFIGLGMLAAVFLDHQSIAVELAGHEDRLSHLEAERVEDRRDAHDFQTEVRGRLDTIIGSISDLSRQMAGKEDLRRR